MSLSLYIMTLLGLAVFSYFLGIKRIRTVTAQQVTAQQGLVPTMPTTPTVPPVVPTMPTETGHAPISPTDTKQHSVDHFHGLFLALYVFLPPMLLIIIWQACAPFVTNYLLETQLVTIFGTLSQGALNIQIAQVKAVYNGSLAAHMVSEQTTLGVAYYARIQQTFSIILPVIATSFAVVGFMFAYRRIALRFPARRHIEKIAIWFMIAASVIAILATLGIILSLIFETLRFFGKVPISEFLFGLHWSPQIAIREGQAGGAGAFGAIPLLVGTFMITLIAMFVAVPIGLMSAIYLSEYATQNIRDFVKPAIEILAGIPTVVYGFFAALWVAPFMRDMGAALGLTLSSESALAAGMVMGIMIIPIISSLSDDVINAVPQSLRDGAAALGATKSETVKQVILPAALPGIMSAILLAISRAIGETMIVVMAAGVAANLTANPFEAVTTVTVQIVVLLTGDQEFDSAKTLAAFALGLLLFFMTLALNILALRIVRKYSENYE